MDLNPVTPSHLRSFCQVQAEDLRQREGIYLTQIVYFDPILQERQGVVSGDLGAESLLRTLGSETWLLEFPVVLTVNPVALPMGAGERGFSGYFCPIGYPNQQPEYILILTDRSLTAGIETNLLRQAQLLIHHLDLYRSHALKTAEVQWLEQAIHRVTHQLKHPLSLIGLYAENLYRNLAPWVSNDRPSTATDSSQNFLPQDTFPQGIFPKDTIPKDTFPRDTFLKDTLPQGTFPKDTFPKDTLPQDTFPKNTFPKDTFPKDTLPQDTFSQDTFPKNTSPQDTFSQDTFPKNTSPQDTVSQDTFSQDTFPKNTSPQDTFSQDTFSQDTFPKNTSPQDTFSQDTFPKNTLPRNLQEQADVIRTTVQDLITHLGELVYCSQASQLRLSWQNLKSVIEDSVAGLGFWIREKELTVIFPQEMPIVLLDRLQMKQVFDNVLNNAIHFSPWAGTITIACHCYQQEILIQIQDQGPGIPADAVQKIFNPFYSQRSGGSGLGLTIARKVIFDHQGNLWAENLPEGGAQFSMILPYRRSQSYSGEVQERSREFTLESNSIPDFNSHAQSRN